MSVTPQVIEETIRCALPVTHLDIEDQSGGCGEKYSIVLVSEAFEGKTTLARHRMVNELLKAQISEMHAFSQKTLTPTQYEAQIPPQKQDLACLSSESTALEG